MLCGICQTEQSKYKCPKCSIPYCSIKCYKSPSHIDPEPTTQQPQQPQSTSSSTTEKDLPPPTQSKWERIANDKIIRDLLAVPALQIHLLTIVKILQDDKIVSNVSDDQRVEVARLKLMDLRSGGVEENVLVEEFVDRVLMLLDENEEN